MPPKRKVAREEIVGAAFEIVRECGDAALNARTLAERLQCSTQPIFSNFRSMDEVRNAVIEQAYRRYRECMRREVESGQYPPYKASGMAYIRFAAEERELFKLLFMRDRTAEAVEEDTEEGREMVAFVQDGTGLTEDNAKLFHLEMWIYVHGIAAMIATNYLKLDWDLISRMLSDSYRSLKNDVSKKE